MATTDLYSQYANPTTPEILGLERQKAYAKMLMTQSAQPQGQMVSGQFVAPSWTQQLNAALNPVIGAFLTKRADDESTKLAQALRKRYGDELSEFLEKQKTDPQAANLFGANAYNPVLQQMAIKRLTQEPKWEKASIPSPDGSERQGWVNVNSPNPLTTFVEGGTKPAYNPLEAARFKYDTGMALPTGPVGAAPAVPTGAPMSGGGVMPAGGVVPPANVPMGAPMGGAPMVGGMSPRARDEANKQILVDVEKRRLENLENAPRAIATIQDTLRNVSDLIGDARVVKDPKTGKERIDYTVTQDGKQVQGRKPQAGFELAVGAGVPSWLPFQGGTDVANFRVRLDQIKDRTFLEAFQQLKGSGQITEKEGEKATSALNRMNLAQSEVEFIKAAREFEENLNRGMALAKQKAGIRDGAPSAKLRWNPQKNAWE